MPGIFTVIPPGDQTGVLSTEITAGLWSPDETGSLASVFTSSIQKAVSGEYFYDLYNLDPSNTANNAEVQFAVAYGHVNGGGSPPFDQNTSYGLLHRPTQTIYSQYRNVLLASGSRFTFGATASNDIYAININRARTKQALDAGNWELRLSGSNGVFSFIDQSVSSLTGYDNIIASSVFEVRSGSLRGTTPVLANDTVYGLVFPDYGTIILHPAAISASVGFSGSNGNGNLNAVSNMAGPFAPYTGSAATTYQYQHEALYRSIRLAMDGGNSFIARSAEQIASKNYSIYLRYDDYNYTNNPSATTTNAAGVRTILPLLQKHGPLTYITTVGLYHTDPSATPGTEAAKPELVAVAKLSRPLLKSEEKSVVIRVRLDY